MFVGVLGGVDLVGLLWVLLVVGVLFVVVYFDYVLCFEFVDDVVWVSDLCVWLGVLCEVMWIDVGVVVVWRNWNLEDVVWWLCYDVLSWVVKYFGVEVILIVYIWCD